MVDATLFANHHVMGSIPGSREVWGLRYGGIWRYAGPTVSTTARISGHGGLGDAHRNAPARPKDRESEKERECATGKGGKMGTERARGERAPRHRLGMFTSYISDI